MGFHTFDADRAEKLEDQSRYRYLSREELVAGLDPDTSDAIADLGSGTGFYTDDVAPFAGEVRAVDVQAEMHEVYREKGVPENVALVTADVADLPFADGELDAAFSTMTFHEFASPESLAEVARVLRSGGRFVVADWTAAGDGESGPPLDERYDRERAVELLDEAGFDVVRADERPETLFAVAER
ncbi:class I SAM-dependent methyltransferase (plasmid) [Halorussus salilacus]|uniref:class I SAM-dependent methyltransferase n=1 Tax=Halorussus salilacus TaxID=2953750 RepID=UPI00209C80E3|nr:class I SAM-dependent methyltransferase [Halorussus salilacus]USZ69970.1 class I SAM-dependent methyltransferase [Halorussus salilacus]